MTSRVWAETDLQVIRHNVAVLKSFMGHRVELMAVVKADAYGHGAAEVARAAMEAGAQYLGVASIAEGAALRKLLPGAAIVLLTPFPPDEAEEVVLHHLIPLISSLESAQALSRAAQRMRSVARAHLDIDTGMGRSGVLPDQVERLVRLLNRMPALIVNGISTHFASAECDPDFTLHQLRTFQRAREIVEAAGVAIQTAHCANSAALLLYPDSRMSLVRPGLLVYGILPPVPDDTPRPALRPALSLKSSIVLIREMPQGYTVGYGRTHTLRRSSRIATIPIGYGDGYPRALSNCGEMLICGRRAPIVGRVNMDVTLVDVTDIPQAQIGSPVVLIGTQGEERITVEEIARRIDTTEHDVTTRLTARVPRKYISQGVAE